MAEYFTQNEGFTRVLTEMAAIYLRYGRVYGAVRLAKPTRQEEEALSAFFERDYFNQALIRISLADFQRQLAKIFPGQNFVALLKKYQTIQSSDEYQRYANSFTIKIMSEIMPKYKNTVAESWLKEICTQLRRTYKYWVEQFLVDATQVCTDIDTVAELCTKLPQQGTKPVYLIDFFQLNSKQEPLFLRALAHIFNIPIPHNRESATELYLNAGLLSGAALCHVTVKNLKDCVLTTGEPCKICEIYSTRQQTHVLTLENIVQFTSVGSNDTVFIIENPMVFDHVCDALRTTEHTIILGQHNPAFIRLLDLLHASGSRLCYAGDMDCKGLARADKLYQRYGRQFIPWRYTKEDYELLMASGSSLCNENQVLAMLNDNLALVLSQIRKTGRIPEPMALVPLLINDIKEFNACKTK